MTKWNRRDRRQELEPYEMDAYELGRSLEVERPQTRIQRREVWLDEEGRPVRLIEEFIEYDN